VRRREFITLLGGVTAWPLVARAQQPVMPVIGYLYSGAAETSAPSLAAFRKGLGEVGFSEGRNVEIEYRWANNEAERLPELAVDLVRRGVAIIVAPGTSGSVLAAMDATKTIPIVFRTGGDPVQLGLVASLNRPGGNVTGVNAMSLETGTKRLGLLLELLPGATRFAVLFNPSGLNAEPARKELQAAAASIGRQIEFFGASSSQQIDAAFTNLVQKRREPDGTSSSEAVGHKIAAARSRKIKERALGLGDQLVQGSDLPASLGRACIHGGGKPCMHTKGCRDQY
jgi:putative ABC transport system substrate-binding protein